MAKKENPTTSVYNKIREKILDGGYAPSENLIETELASEYDVSRNTVKKALLMLESDGFITMEANKGAKVRSFSKKELLDFLQLREVLEGFVIRLAVPQLSDEQIRLLEDTIAQMKTLSEENRLLEYSAQNHKLHDFIYDACPNQTAVEVIKKLKRQMSKYNGKSILVPGRKEQSLKEHIDIVDAIKKRDVDLAEKCMNIHMHNVMVALDDYYSILF